METQIMKSQRGFTLVEIIAVLIILGILAAVATPKFFDMQVEAEKKALKGAVAELNAQAKMSWAMNKLGGETGAALYTGYGTDSDGAALDDILGADFEVTGQGANDPDDGTIKLTDGNDTYAIVWTTPMAVDDSPGYFVMALEKNE